MLSSPWSCITEEDGRRVAGRGLGKFISKKCTCRSVGTFKAKGIIVWLGRVAELAIQGVCSYWG